MPKPVGSGATGEGARPGSRVARTQPAGCEGGGSAPVAEAAPAGCDASDTGEAAAAAAEMAVGPPSGSALVAGIESAIESVTSYIAHSDALSA